MIEYNATKRRSGPLALLTRPAMGLHDSLAGHGDQWRAFDVQQELVRRRQRRVGAISKAGVGGDDRIQGVGLECRIKKRMHGPDSKIGLRDRAQGSD